MNPHVFQYAVIPSVVPAGRESTVAIFPRGENTAFHSDMTYTLRVREVDTACRRFDELPTAVYTCRPDADGALRFTHRFEREQRYVLLLERPEEDLVSPYKAINYRSKYGLNREAVLSVFALEEDWYGLRGFKGEVHCHTWESDGIQDVCHTVGNYRAAGYDFLAITDHYLSMSSEKAMRVFADAPVDMTLLLGEEVHLPTERIHAVHLGGRQSVNAWFREHREEAFAAVEALKAKLELPDGIDPEDYAWRVLIADKSREFGGLSILAHPHWIWQQVYFMPEDATRQLLWQGVYDALDLRDTDPDVSVALWAELRAAGCQIPVVGSTDSHQTDPADDSLPAAGGYTLVLAPDRQPQSLMDAVRDERSAAVFTTAGPERIYGPYRMVKFARFLLEEFEPMYQYLCRGQGPLMSAYPPRGEPDGDTVTALEILNRRSEAFAREFYGM